ncbi:MAG: hypothetical protein ACP5P3_01480 [Ignavibacteria bacterium]
MLKIRFLSIVFILFLLTQLGYSQTYIVLKVKGEILNEQTGQLLKAKDELNLNDRITFKSNKALAALYNKDSGRFLLKPMKKFEGEFTEYVYASLIKSKGVIDKGLFSLQKEFESPYFVIGEFKFKINSKEYPITNNSYFFIRYIYQDDTISKKISFTSDEIIFDKNFIYTIEDKQIDQELVDRVDLYYTYMKNDKQREQLISKFILRFADEEGLKKELESYMELLSASGKNKDEISEELIAYIVDVYGRTNYDYAKTWLKDTYGL